MGTEVRERAFVVEEQTSQKDSAESVFGGIEETIMRKNEASVDFVERTY